MNTCYHDIHGTHVAITAEADTSRQLADRLLEYFHTISGPNGTILEISVHQVSGSEDLPRVPESARLLYSSYSARTGDAPSLGAWSVYRHAEGEMVQFRGVASVSVQSPGTRAFIHLAEPVDPENDDLLYCLHFGLVEVLKRRGLFTIHAAALERDEQGVLIAGASGQGKTTACLSLARAGYRCLADDHPFLRNDGGQIGIYAFPEPMAVTDVTRCMIPELGSADTAFQPADNKLSFHLEDVYGANAWARTAVSRVILFPQVIDWPTSYVEPVSKAQCLQELLLHGFRALNRDVAAAHFHLLARLADQAPAYRLFLGANVLALPDLIGPLLAS